MNGHSSDGVGPAQLSEASDGRSATATSASDTAAAASPDPTTGSGLVIASHGRHYMVTSDQGGPPLQCFPRGKKSDMAVGDRVQYLQSSANQGVIVEIEPRSTLLFRSDQYKSKLFAANLDQMMIVLATEPHFSGELLGRALVAAAAHQLDALIVLNKIDVATAVPQAQARLALYRELKYEVLEVSAKDSPETTRERLVERLSGRSTLLLGQSGMGKSTLVNLLVPGADVATREISLALHSGKHTTTFTRLHRLPEGGALIDSPGFQEFGLHHLSEGQLERAFPEFEPYLGHCRFYNCHHLQEPGCAILQAVVDGKVTPGRHALYAQLVHESSQVVR